MTSSSWCTAGRLQAYQGLLPASIVSALALRRALPLPRALPGLRQPRSVAVAPRNARPGAAAGGGLGAVAAVGGSRGDASLLKAHALSQQALLSQLPPSPPPFSLWSSLFWNGGNLLLRGYGVLYYVGSNVMEWGVMVLRAAFLLRPLPPRGAHGAPGAPRGGSTGGAGCGWFAARWSARGPRSSSGASGPPPAPTCFPGTCVPSSSTCTARPRRMTTPPRGARVERAFGCQLSDIFASFDVEPIASGSIAQVHRAESATSEIGFMA